MKALRFLVSDKFYLSVVGLLGLFFCCFVMYEVYGHYFSPIIDVGSGYYKDILHVYHNGQVIQGAHPRTFELLENDFARDRQHIFFKDNIVNQTNPDSFRVLSDRYALDAEQVYFFHTPIERADPATFEIIYGDYTRDARQVFFRGEVLSNIDPETFAILDVEYNIIRDKNGTYQDGKEITLSFPYGFARWGESFHFFDGYKLGLLEQPFESLGGWYIRDEKGVYYKFTLLSEVNPQTFTVIDTDVGRDDTTVMYKEFVLKNANPDTIEILGDGMYAWDGNSVYYLSIQEANHAHMGESGYDDLPSFRTNVREFKVLGLGYATDTKTLFYQDTDLGAYDESFQIVEGEDWDAKTDTAYFKDGARVDAVIGSWKLVSPLSFTSCTELSYEGREELRGWYEYVSDYIDSTWAFRVAEEDIRRLPLTEYGNAIKLTNVSDELEKKLKKSSEKDQMTIGIVSFLAYCEGIPRAEVSIAE